MRGDLLVQGDKPRSLLPDDGPRRLAAPGVSEAYSCDGIAFGRDGQGGLGQLLAALFAFEQGIDRYGFGLFGREPPLALVGRWTRAGPALGVVPPVSRVVVGKFGIFRRRDHDLLSHQRFGGGSRERDARADDVQFDLVGFGRRRQRGAFLLQRHGPDLDFTGLCEGGRVGENARSFRLGEARLGGRFPADDVLAGLDRLALAGHTSLERGLPAHGEAAAGRAFLLQCYLDRRDVQPELRRGGLVVGIDDLHRGDDVLFPRRQGVDGRIVLGRLGVQEQVLVRRLAARSFGADLHRRACGRALSIRLEGHSKIGSLVAAGGGNGKRAGRSFAAGGGKRLLDARLAPVERRHAPRALPELFGPTHRGFIDFVVGWLPGKRFPERIRFGDLAVQPAKVIRALASNCPCAVQVRSEVLGGHDALGLRGFSLQIGHRAGVGGLVAGVAERVPRPAVLARFPQAHLGFHFLPFLLGVLGLRIDLSVEDAVRILTPLAKDRRQPGEMLLFPLPEDREHLFGVLFALLICLSCCRGHAGFGQLRRGGLFQRQGCVPRVRCPDRCGRARSAVIAARGRVRLLRRRGRVGLLRLALVRALGWLPGGLAWRARRGGAAGLAWGALGRLAAGLARHALGRRDRRRGGRERRNLRRRRCGRLRRDGGGRQGGRCAVVVLGRLIVRFARAILIRFGLLRLLLLVRGGGRRQPRDGGGQFLAFLGRHADPHGRRPRFWGLDQGLRTALLHNPAVFARPLVAQGTPRRRGIGRGGRDDGCARLRGVRAERQGNGGVFRGAYGDGGLNGGLHGRFGLETEGRPHRGLPRLRRGERRLERTPLGEGGSVLVRSPLHEQFALIEQGAQGGVGEPGLEDARHALDHLLARRNEQHALGNQLLEVHGLGVKRLHLLPGVLVPGLIGRLLARHGRLEVRNGRVGGVLGRCDGSDVALVEGRAVAIRHLRQDAQGLEVGLVQHIRGSAFDLGDVLHDGVGGGHEAAPGLPGLGRVLEEIPRERKRQDFRFLVARAVHDVLEGVAGLLEDGFVGLKRGLEILAFGKGLVPFGGRLPGEGGGPGHGRGPGDGRFPGGDGNPEITRPGRTLGGLLGQVHSERGAPEVFELALDFHEPLDGLIRSRERLVRVLGQGDEVGDHHVGEDVVGALFDFVLVDGDQLAPLLGQFGASALHGKE